MPPRAANRRGPGRPPRHVIQQRAASSAAENEYVEELVHTERPPQRRRVERENSSEVVGNNIQDELAALRRENEELRRGQPNANLGVPRQQARRQIEEGGVSMFRFMKLGLPEFKGEDGSDPQVFIEEIEKVIKRLPCSDARVIELTGLILKDYAWEWFLRNIEEVLYSENPPTWEMFKEALIEEFLPEGEKEARLIQFEQLRQKDMSVVEYACEFKRLSKWAKHIVPTEAAKINRFCRGLNASLHNILCAIPFISLNKMIDKAKIIEEKLKQEQDEKIIERRTQNFGGSQRQNPPRPQSQVMSFKKEKDKAESFSVNAPGMSGERVNSQQESSEVPVCARCGKRHRGECRLTTGACLKCGKHGHFYRQCPQLFK